MKEITYKIRGKLPPIKYLGIMVLAILMLVNIAGAVPYAYITNNDYPGTITIIDTATNTVINTVSVGNAPLGVAVNPEGTKVYVASWSSNTVSVIDTSTNTVIDTVDVGIQAWGIAVNPAGTTVYVTGSDSGIVSVINTTTNTVTATVDVGSYPVGVAVAPDGKNVYVANQHGSTVSIIDAANNTVTTTVNVGNHPLGVAFNPAGTTAYVTNSDSGSVSAIDTATNTVVASVSVGSYPYGVAVNPEGTKVYVANYNDSNVSVIDTATNAVTSTVSVGLHPHGIAVTPNGKKVFVANEDGNISVIDTATNNVTTTVKAGYNPIALGQFIGPDLDINAPVANFTSNVTEGTVPLSVQFTDLSQNATERYWDFGDGNNSDQQNPTHTYSVTGTYTVALTVSNSAGQSTKTGEMDVKSPSQTCPYAYITNDINSTVNVIDTASDTVIATVPVGWSPFGIAVNPKGTKAYVGSWGEGTIYVIDTATNTVTATVHAGNGYDLNGIAISPDGMKVYAAKNDKTNSVSVIDTATNNITATVTLGDYGGGVAVNPMGTRVYVTSAGGMNVVYVIDTSNYTVTDTVPVEIGSCGLAVNPSGTKIYVPNENSNNVSVIDTTTNNVTATVPVGSQPYGVAFNPAGTKLYVVSDNVTYVVDTASNTVTDMVPVGGLRGSVALTPDGNKIYVLGKGNVSVIDAATSTITATLVGTVGNTPSIGQFIVSPSTTPMPPVANFTSNVTKGTSPLSVQFTDLSENATEWHWDFGDGSYSTQRNPTHTYIEEGIYTVNLTVSNAIGTDLKLATIAVSSGSAVLSFNPQKVDVLPGYSQDVQIMMDEVPEGLSGFNITISVSDPEIAEITAVSFPIWGQLPKNSTLPSSSVWIKTVDFENEVHSGDTNVLLGTITLTGKKAGTSDLSIVKTMISDDNGSLINPVMNTGKINVVILPAFPGYTNLPSDLNQDGLYEDINGNGMLDFNDVVAFYNNMDWIEVNVPLKFFDYNKNGLIDFDDVVKIYDML
jgi:YVTN family beta-propeller protein